MQRGWNCCRKETPPLRSQFRGLSLSDLKEVIRGDLQFVELVGTDRVNLLGVCNLTLPTMPPIAIQYDTDVSWHRSRSDLPRQPALVKAIELSQ
jgi:hypothetical protein